MLKAERAAKLPHSVRVEATFADQSSPRSQRGIAPANEPDSVRVGSNLSICPCVVSKLA